MVAQVGKLMQIVRGDDDGTLLLSHIFEQKIFDEIAFGGVKTVKALVKQYDLRHCGHGEHDFRLTLHTL